jgi:ribonuclease-3
MRDLSQLQAELGYAFQNKKLIECALRHSSVMKKVGKSVDRSFDRLEFLGDRVLNLAVAEFLYRKFDNESEGDLAHRYAALVCFETCADIARKVHIDKYLEVAAGTFFDDLRILCDALEAVIGAMYLDGGYEPCQMFIEKNWHDLFFSAVAPPTDPKSTLQELVQSRGGQLPEYVVLEKTGNDHNPMFTVSVHASGWPHVTGIGQSKKSAEKDAASKLLDLIKGAAHA